MGEHAKHADEIEYEVRTMEAIIGRLNWQACNHCGHYDLKKGCTVDDIEIERDGDYVMCSEFMRK